MLLALLRRLQRQKRNKKILDEVKKVTHNDLCDILPKLDRELYGGMGVCAGRLREDKIFDWKFVGLSHNTLRGAAGGAVLLAELLCAKGYVKKR